MKNARRIFAIVSTTSIPKPAPMSPMEATVDRRRRGPDWMPITPKTGSLFHAYSQVKLGQEHEVEGDRASRSSGCAGPVEPLGVLTFARTPSANRQRLLHGTWVRRDGAVL